MPTEDTHEDIRRYEEQIERELAEEAAWLASEEARRDLAHEEGW
jgi:hypothetical protein